jgi:hypothetical protein
MCWDELFESMRNTPWCLCLHCCAWRHATCAAQIGTATTVPVTCRESTHATPSQTTSSTVHAMMHLHDEGQPRCSIQTLVHDSVGAACQAVSAQHAQLLHGTHQLTLLPMHHKAGASRILLLHLLLNWSSRKQHCAACWRLSLVPTTSPPPSAAPEATCR